MQELQIVPSTWRHLAVETSTRTLQILTQRHGRYSLVALYSISEVMQTIKTAYQSIIDTI